MSKLKFALTLACVVALSKHARAEPEKGEQGEPVEAVDRTQPHLKVWPPSYAKRPLTLPAGWMRGDVHVPIIRFIDVHGIHTAAFLGGGIGVTDDLQIDVAWGAAFSGSTVGQPSPECDRPAKRPNLRRARPGMRFALPNVQAAIM